EGLVHLLPSRTRHPFAIGVVVHDASWARLCDTTADGLHRRHPLPRRHLRRRESKVEDEEEVLGRSQSAAAKRARTRRSMRPEDWGLLVIEGLRLAVTLLSSVGRVKSDSVGGRP